MQKPLQPLQKPSSKLNHKEFINKVSSNSDLLQYEVEDALLVIALALTKTLSEGSSVHIQGVGTFTPKKTRQRAFRSNLKGNKEVLLESKNSCSFKPCIMLKNALNLKITN